MRPYPATGFCQRRNGREPQPRGFTLIELMITLTVLAVVMIVMMTIMNAASRSKTATANAIESTEAASAALAMMTRDLRSAGYHADIYWLAAPQPPIAYIDSLQVLMNADFVSLAPSAAADTIPWQPQAYNPAGNPKPFPLTGTTWTPPIKYRRGAEIVRWTLDVNNDGAVNSGDVADANGADAQRTANPNDFTLVRQVYGDSVGNVAGNNGGVLQRVALVQKPGGSVPPMFQVYLAGQSTPWDWSLGPVPASKLQQINKIQVTVVAASNKPDKRGQFAQTKLTSTVSSLRNTPNNGRTLYAIDGYVFNDLNHNASQDPPLELGVPNAVVRCGQFSATTSAAGYFVFQLEAGKYTLRNIPPMGWGVSNSPDSFVVTVPPAVSQSLADTAMAGGWVSVNVFNDLDGNGSVGAGENPIQNVPVTLNPGSRTAYTDASGNALLFAGVGSYTVSATPPDSFAATTSNPVTGTMTNGGSASHLIGLARTSTGTVQGMVYRDANRNGVYDAGEQPVANVWVGVTPDNGVTVLGYQLTNAAGTYSIVVPSNVPPSTKPYQVMMVTPNGYYATTSTVLQPIWLSANQVLTGKNFGLLDYQIITLNASRILSIASGDLLEKTGGGDNGGSGAHKDVDIVLGADTGATDNLSIWFNDYNNNPLFSTLPSYTRDAPSSILSIALDTLDTGSPKARLDCVTGTKLASLTNFQVWLSQNGGSNESYFTSTATRSYRTWDLGDVQSVLTGDICGGSGPDQPDILVGTKSPTANQGSIELWASDNAATPSFSRVEIYPTVGGIPSSILGEVTCMALTDFNNDGIKDLVVGTKRGTYSGQLMFLRGNGKTTGPSRFGHAVTYDIAGIVTALVPVQSDFDTRTDVIIGVQTGVSTGELQEWTNTTISGTISFVNSHTVTAPGIVMALNAAELGGLPGHSDLAVGWRADPVGFAGGVRVYYLDSGALTSTSTDPSAGYIVNMAPCLTSANFNFGVQPSLPPTPWLTDLAVGVKKDPATGLLVIFVR